MNRENRDISHLRFFIFFLKHNVSYIIRDPKLINYPTRNPTKIILNISIDAGIVYSPIGNLFLASKLSTRDSYATDRIGNVDSYKVQRKYPRVKALESFNMFSDVKGTSLVR